MQTEMQVEWDCRVEDGEDVVIVGVGQTTGRLYLFGPECAFNAMSDGNKVSHDAYGEELHGEPETVTWQGTHTLPG